MKKIVLLPLYVLSIFFMSHVSAMDFTTFDGKKSTLENEVASGKWSLVVFWSHTCGICRRETPALTAFHVKHKNIDVEVIGVNIDGLKDKSKSELFMAETEMGFPTFTANIADIADDFFQLTGEPFRGTPTFLLYDSAGKLLGTQIGPIETKAVEAFMQKYAENS